MSDELANVSDELANVSDELANAVVHKTGNETIAGAKTFSANLTVKKNDPYIYVSHTQLKKGVVPSGVEQAGFSVTDADGATLAGAFYSAGGSSGALRQALRLYKNEAGSSSYAQLSVYYDAQTDTFWGEAPSTPTGASGAEIVTADYAKSLGGVAASANHLGNVDVDTVLTPGFYYLTGADTNLPSGTNGYVQVLNTAFGAGGNIRQVFWRAGTVNSNDHAMYIRLISGTSFGNWVQVLTGKGGTIQDAVPRLHFLDTDITRKTLPASENGLGITFKDSAAAVIGELIYHVYSDGETRLELSAYNWMGSGEAKLGVAYGADRGPYGYAPTPQETSNTNDIATTAWVRARSKWVYKNASLATDATLGKRVLDLTNYLPDDNEEYEVLVRMRIERSDSNGTNTVGTLYLASNAKFMLLQADGSNWQQQSESSIVPVPSNHQLSYEVGGYSPATFEISAYGYRKA